MWQRESTLFSYGFFPAATVCVIFPFYARNFLPHSTLNRNAGLSAERHELPCPRAHLKPRGLNLRDNTEIVLGRGDAFRYVSSPVP